LTRWRDEIAAGTRRGPKIFLAGPLLDGPKPGATFRLTIRTPEDAVRAVDSLAGRVDFLKTHNAIPPEAFAPWVRRARERGLKVAAHLPVGVPAWTAAEAGVGSIEHAAESLPRVRFTRASRRTGTRRWTGGDRLTAMPPSGASLPRG
jgi:hypothetical protein